MPTLNSHTHCQAAQAQAQTKAWQRVCLNQRTDEKKARAYNRVDGSVRSSDGVHLSNVNSRIPIKNNEQYYEYTTKRTRALLLSFSKMSPRHF